MKKFIITIDTEGDNLWSWKYGDEITSENSLYIPRFQSLCDKYGFKPTYLTNYEMATDKRFVDFARQAQNEGRCEIGMHLHAINNPPLSHSLNVYNESNFPYLIEFTTEEMEAKIAFITNLLQDSFQTEIISHRSGRWALDERYIELLVKYGYKIDCSVTPGIDWSTHGGITREGKGSDYTHAPSTLYYIDKDKKLLEVPVTLPVLKDHLKLSGSIKDFMRSVKHSILGRQYWMRPSGRNLEDLLFMASELKGRNDNDYIMFMLHSSEMMPGGSPTFKTAEDIEVLYKHLDIVFAEISTFCSGATIKELYKELEK